MSDFKRNQQKDRKKSLKKGLMEDIDPHQSLLAGKQVMNDCDQQWPLNSSDVIKEGGYVFDDDANDEQDDDKNSEFSAEFTEGNRCYESQYVVIKEDLEQLQNEINHAKDLCNHSNNQDQRYDQEDSTLPLWDQLDEQSPYQQAAKVILPKFSLLKDTVKNQMCRMLNDLIDDADQIDEIIHQGQEAQDILIYSLTDQMKEAQGERVLWDYFIFFMEKSREIFGQGASIDITRDESDQIYQIMCKAGFSKEDINTMWNCTFSKYFDANEISIIHNLDQWALKAEDTDLSQLYMDMVKQNFYCHYPQEENWLKDDLLFHQNRVYVFSRIIVPYTHNDTYEARINIIKPKMDSLGENDLFKKRPKEKRDELPHFKYQKSENQIEEHDSYLIKIPDDKDCQFYDRYIRVPNNYQKELDVLQNGRFVYYFQTERVGTHQDGTTIFRLIEIDLEKKNSCRLIKEYKFEDDRGREDQDYLAVSIEFIENQTEHVYTESLQKIKNEKFPSFLETYFVQIKFAKFYSGELFDQDHLLSPVSIRLCPIMELDSWQNHSIAIYKGTIRERIKTTLIDQQDINQMQRMDSGSNLRDLQRSEVKEALLLMVEHKNEIKMYEVYDIIRNNIKKKPNNAEQNEEDHMKFTIDTGSIKLTKQMVEKYNRIVKDNNFRYLYDKEQGKYFFQRIEPIYHGTVIIDMLTNRVITFEKKFENLDVNNQIKKLSKVQSNRKPRQSTKSRQQLKQNKSFLSLPNSSKIEDDYEKSSDDDQQYEKLTFYEQQQHLKMISDSKYTINDKVLHLESRTTGSKYGQRILEMEQTKLCLSNCLVNFFTDQMKEKNNKNQVVVNKSFKNIIRCEENVFIWGHLKKTEIVEDKKVYIEDLPLDNVNIFTDDRYLRRVVTYYEKRQRLQVDDPSQLWDRFMVHSNYSDNIKEMQTQDHSKINIRFESTKVENKEVKKLLDSDSHNQIYIDVKDSIDLTKSSYVKYNQFGDMEFKELAKKQEEKMKKSEQWHMIFERVKFSNDKRHMVPIILQQTLSNKNSDIQTSTNSSSQREHTVWFCIFDTFNKSILQMHKIQLHLESIKFFNPRICLSVCGEIKKTIIRQQSGDTTFYSQNYQVAINLTHQLRIKILEYQVVWIYENDNGISDEKVRKSPKIQIKLVAGQEFILKKDSPGRLSDISEICLIPLLDENTNNIKGTQLIIRRDDKNETKTYRLDKFNFQEFQAPRNILIENQGYKIYRNECTGDYEAVQAFAVLNKKVWNDSSNNLSMPEQYEILGSVIKSLLNCVIYDPLLPIPSVTSLNDIEFAKKFKQGRPIELFEWYSMIMIRKSSIKRLKDLLDNIQINESYSVEIYQRIVDLQFSSLLERVLTNDFYQFNKESPSFNRLETLRQDGLWLEKHELLMKDVHQMNPLDYMFQIERFSKMTKSIDSDDNEVSSASFNVPSSRQTQYKKTRVSRRSSSVYDRNATFSSEDVLAKNKETTAVLVTLDSQIDLILRKVFAETHQKYQDESQNQLLSRFMNFIRRDNNMEVYYDNFIAQHEQQNDQLNSLNLSQRIDNSNYEFCNSKLMVFYENIPRDQSIRQENNTSIVQSCLVEQENNGQLQHGDYLVQCSLLDGRRQFMQNKIDYMRCRIYYNEKKDFDEEFENRSPNDIMTMYKMAKMLDTVLEKVPNDIEKQKIIRDILNHQYMQSQHEFHLQFFGYVIFFLLPFIAQQHATQSQFIYGFNYWCLLIQVLLFLHECIQIYVQKFDYFFEFWNYFDMLGALLQIYYFFVRITNPVIGVPPTEIKTETPIYEFHGMTWQTPLLNAVLLVCAMIKVLFYLRAYNEIGIIVQLLGVCIKNIAFFLLFMVAWILVFYQINILLGVDFDSDFDSQNELPYLRRVFIQTWKNSFGDFGSPKYVQWESLVQHRTDDFFPSPQLYINLIWFVYIMNQLFIAVVLVNFLIAMVTQQYEKVMQQRLKNEFMHKSQLNMEKSLMDALFNRCNRRSTLEFNSLIVFSQSEAQQEKDDDEWNGFVDSIKKIVNVYFLTMQEKILQTDKNGQQRHAMIQGQLDNQALDIQDIRQSQMRLKSTVEGIKDNVNDIKDDIAWIKTQFQHNQLEE